LGGERSDDQRRVTERTLDGHLHRLGSARPRKRPHRAVPPPAERFDLPPMEREQAWTFADTGRGAGRVDREPYADSIEIGSECQTRLPVAEMPLQHEVVAHDVEVDAASR